MLRIKTFAESGVSCFFKALGHLEIQPQLRTLIQTINSCKKIAVYDPDGRLEEFADLTSIDANIFSEVFIQKLDLTDNPGVQLISKVTGSKSEILLILAFDGQRFHDHIKHLLPSTMQVITLDQVRLPDNMLVNRNQYLHPLNWATNFIWFCEEKGRHTRMVTANYWVKYGGKDVVAYMYLLDASGKCLAHWHEKLANKLDIFTIDSKEIKSRFKLADFMGQVFIHFVGAAGHDIVKYALDVYGDDASTLSATHDANAWPCRYFAGLPAAKSEERVLLWLQNTHPITIKPGLVGLNIMGEDEIRYINHEIMPYASIAVDPARYFPDVKFPAQFEIEAGNYFVRPRYEIENLQSKRRCIAHVNVERDNLLPDPSIKKITKHIGKGYILSAPILPIEQYTSQILPTPMSRSLKTLPIKAMIYGSDGAMLAVHEFGNLPRNHQQFLSVDELVRGLAYFKVPGNYGNMQIIYDFTAGDEADGWLHGIFKYHHKQTGHFAETSFGSHIFNNVTTYKGEPQSYKGPPPGLTTGLFLRVGPAHLNSLCYLIYPVSNQWHALSSTQVSLYDGENEVAQHIVKIAANGCYLLDCHQIFGQELIKSLHNPFVIITDRTCRLFGYHMLTNGQAFSLDHMFGF